MCASWQQQAVKQLNHPAKIMSQSHVYLRGQPGKSTQANAVIVQEAIGENTRWLAQTGQVDDGGGGKKRVHPTHNAEVNLIRSENHPGHHYIG